MTTGTNIKNTTEQHDRDYNKLLAYVRKSFDDAVATKQPLFYVDGGQDLFETFLDNLPADRQTHSCNCCKHFFRKYGPVVTIDKNGTVRPAMFNSGYLVPKFYAEALDALEDSITSAKVLGVFVSEEKKWGIPQTGVWTHMAVIPPKELVHVNAYGLKDAYQRQAELKTDYQVLRESLGEYKLDSIDKAIAFIEGEVLYRGKKYEAPLQWFRDLHVRYHAQKNRAKKDAMIWASVATAPVGFARVRAKNHGVLLDDVQKGLPPNEVKALFDSRMDPLKHNRSQTDPGAGNIKQGEKIIAAIGLQPSLARRFATLADLRNIWTPKAAQVAETEGVFGHLTPRGGIKKGDMLVIGATTGVAARKMTFVKFARDVLPNVEEMSIYTPDQAINFAAYVTATHADAPPLIQWDTDEFRNPVTWYVYHKGTRPQAWNLTPGWQKVVALSPQPSRWNPANANAMHGHGDGLLFVIDGCKDTNYLSAGLGLFPEFLRGELHEVRKTIEAFSQNGVISGYQNASACGVRVTSDQPFGNLRIRVKSKGVTQELILDRWE